MIELTEEQVRQAFKRAKSDDAKGILESLFPDVAKEITKKKPTLDDYTSITSYEDACEALGESPILSEDHVRRKTATEGDVTFLFSGWVRTNVHAETPLGSLPRHIVALMKLETISRALWGRECKHKPDAEGGKEFYWPLFALWTNKEILYAKTLSSRESVYLGFRLCQETQEKARYFGGRNFVKLWAEYLQFNFEAGDFIIQQKNEYELRQG